MSTLTRPEESWIDRGVKKAVNAYFAPPNVGRLVRNVVLNTLFLCAVVAAALQLSGPVAWALWVFVAWRVYGLTTLTVGGRVLQERDRRLAALPAHWHRFLTTGGGGVSSVTVQITTDTAGLAAALARPYPPRGKPDPAVAFVEAYARVEALNAATADHMNALADMVQAGMQPYQLRHLARVLGTQARDTSTPPRRHA